MIGNKYFVADPLRYIHCYYNIFILFKLWINNLLRMDKFPHKDVDGNLFFYDMNDCQSSCKNGQFSVLFIFRGESLISHDKNAIF